MLALLDDIQHRATAILMPASAGRRRASSSPTSYDIWANHIILQIKDKFQRPPLGQNSAANMIDWWPWVSRPFEKCTSYNKIPCPFYLFSWKQKIYLQTNTEGIISITITFVHYITGVCFGGRISVWTNNNCEMHRKQIPVHISNFVIFGYLALIYFMYIPYWLFFTFIALVAHVSVNKNTVILLLEHYW